jgi:hypothetical protein
MENPTIYQDIASWYSLPAPSQEAAIPIQVQPVATIVKTRADKTNEARMNKSKASMQLFLVRPGTSNIDGTHILIPSPLDETYKDLVLQETPRNAFRNLNMLFRTNIKGKKERDPMHLMYFYTLFRMSSSMPFSPPLSWAAIGPPNPFMSIHTVWGRPLGPFLLPPPRPIQLNTSVR